TAKDLLIDLKNLKRKLDVDAEIERTVPPELRSTAGGAQSTVSNAQQSGAQTIGGEQARPTSSAEYIVSEIKRHKLAALISILILVAGVIGLVVYMQARRSSEAAIDSIAVLPFQNRSTEPDADYLSDGLAESLIYRLSQLPNLKVSPTSLAFRYKGKEVDPIKVGNELGVSAVLSGRITQRGDNLTISAELVDVRNNKLL